VLFVTNVFDETVVRLHHSLPDQAVPRVSDETVIDSGFAQHPDPAALEVGPTGVGLSRHGTMYVADTASNRIAAIPDAVRRDSTANGNDGNMVEVVPSSGTQFTKTLDAAGMLFGLAATPDHEGICWVDDASNTLNRLH
jgi:sugar lactone lactonase YvrE